MPKPVLVGYDPRRLDRAPVLVGAALARLTGAPLVIAAVDAGPPPPPDEAQDARAERDPDLVDDATAALEDIDAEVRASQLPVETLRLEGRSAAQALHEEAERHRAGVLVVGSSRRAHAGRALLGGTAQRLFGGAPCPVCVVPPGLAHEPELRTIAVGYVATDEGREALRAGHALARLAGARLRVVSVLRPRPLFDAGQARPPIAGQAATRVEDVEGDRAHAAAERLRAELAELGEDVATEVEVVIGDPEDDPAESLIAISEHVDLLSCGSRGYGPLRAVLLGSVSARVTAAAACPVLVLPRGVRAPLVALTGAGEDAATRPAAA